MSFDPSDRGTDSFAVMGAGLHRFRDCGGIRHPRYLGHWHCGDFASSPCIACAEYG